ncbi:hypothetical protein L3X38_028140 [Prunus dulcis]|uniref:Uncharacterized protein n=1 Tax=Prunus dulcis TaxID=3755 RepID=A0AAD4VPD5_PRUDU|nr:hypothetical protein L3X38_028140 [Prunus dulcis]
MVVIPLAGQNLGGSARHQYLHPISLLVKLMMKTQRAIRRSCIEMLNVKEDKKWPPLCISSITTPPRISQGE